MRTICALVLSMLLGPSLVAAEIGDIVPSGLEARGGIGIVFLEWDNPFRVYGNHSHTNVYRNSVDQLGTATKIGQSPYVLYTDEDVDSETTYYYWIQWVDAEGLESKISSSVEVETATDPDEFYEEINDWLINSQLLEDLRSPIHVLDESSNFWQIASDPVDTTTSTSAPVTNTGSVSIPIPSQSQWHEPEIDFGALSQECPRWSDSNENCPYLLEFHGYDIYLGKSLVDDRAETWEFNGLSAIDRFLLSDEEQAQIQRDEYFYNEDPDRALSKHLLVFLAAFETVFVPESPNFSQRNSQDVPELVSLLRDLESVPNASPEHPDSLGFYIGSIRTDEAIPTSANICVNGSCKTCTNGNCSDGSVLGFVGSGEDAHFPDCGTHAVACYNTRQFAFGLYLANTYHENLYVLTHEFGHVWHQLFVPDGFDNSCVMQNFDAAKEADRFRDYGATTTRGRFDSATSIANWLIDSPPARGSQEWLDFWNQRKGGGASYAASSHYEYFAELTAIWFGNQWEYRGYPGDAGELWEHDLPSYEMIRQAYSESLLSDFPTDCK